MTFRRHSVSSPVLDAQQTHLQKSVADPESSGLENINDYFGNVENRAKAWAQAGRNIQAISARGDSASSVTCIDSSYNWPLYVVEFKAGRIDFFFVTDGLVVRKGDLVIVEADRGKDLGKVIEHSIYSMEQLQFFKQELESKLPELYSGNKAIVPKRIFRLAQPSETTMLFVKSEDEKKAMTACQLKILAKNLPMEIVDAEYQW